jgi:elongation factor Tu
MNAADLAKAKGSDPADPAAAAPGRPVAMDVGLGFAVGNGGRTVAVGTVTEPFD